MLLVLYWCIFRAQKLVISRSTYKPDMHSWSHHLSFLFEMCVCPTVIQRDCVKTLLCICCDLLLVKTHACDKIRTLACRPARGFWHLVCGILKNNWILKNNSIRNTQWSTWMFTLVLYKIRRLITSNERTRIYLHTEITSLWNSLIEHDLAPQLTNTV